MYFNENGDQAAKYDIINWQPRADGSVGFVVVGLYDASVPAHRQLTVRNIPLVWAHNSRQVRPGSREADLMKEFSFIYDNVFIKQMLSLVRLIRPLCPAGPCVCVQ